MIIFSVIYFAIFMASCFFAGRLSVYLTEKTITFMYQQLGMRVDKHPRLWLVGVCIFYMIILIQVLLRLFYGYVVLF